MNNVAILNMNNDSLFDAIIANIDLGRDIGFKVSEHPNLATVLRDVYFDHDGMCDASDLAALRDAAVRFGVDLATPYV
jgi:hypothetical protein